MRNLFAAIYFVLALFGCESGGTTMITRSVVDGVDVIHARTHVKAGVARFECLTSASGLCHYALFPRECASSQGRCDDQLMDRLTIPVGEKREMVGLSEFDVCVSQTGASSGRDCVQNE